VTDTATTASPVVEEFKRLFSRPVSFARADMLPATLYHYTGAGGVAGILSSDHLRASNFSFLNDPSEVQHGHELVMSTLQRERRARGLAQVRILSRIEKSFAAEVVSEVYVACFTTRRDDLSQWRAYGGASAARYAIGFDSEVIRERAWAVPEAMFDRVIYDEAQQVERVNRIITKTLQFVVTKLLGKMETQAIASEAARRLARLLPRLKSPAYAAEEEWRFIRWVPVTAVADVQFDTARGTVRPYVHFVTKAASSLPVTELIVMAPGRERASLKAADMLLNKMRIHNVSAAHSQVPFAE
jgi:hypothetical protein